MKLFAPSRILVLTLALSGLSLADISHRYLFVGHPREDNPGEYVQRQVERIDFNAYDLLLLGGDLTWRGTGERSTVDYLDAVFDLDAPTTLTAVGNHDTSNKSYLTDVTGRPLFYSHEENGVTFVVLDTTDNSQNILGAELQLLEDTIDALPSDSHLVLIHHHLIWLADYAPLAHLIGSPLIGASSSNLSGLNFYSAVYPLLLEARAKSVEVLCLGGDRTGSETEEFFIDHTTVDGVRYIGAGLKKELVPELRSVVVLEHDTGNNTLTPVIQNLSDLPMVPDEPLVINELHYNPAPAEGNDHAFIELLNRGDQPYDLSGASFVSGVVCTFPENTIVPPGGRVVVAAEPDYFMDLNVPVFNWSGVDKPSSGEPIWLRAGTGLEIDYVDYGTTSPWPTPPNNTGPSLSLINAAVDNNLPSSWASSDQDSGTAGATNFPNPILSVLGLRSGGTATTLWIQAVPNAWYQLQSTNSLDPPVWEDAGPAQQAASTTILMNDSSAAGARVRFFRLARIFP